MKKFMLLLAVVSVSVLTVAGCGGSQAEQAAPQEVQSRAQQNADSLNQRNQQGSTASGSTQSR
jgi:ABC-type glycerol-3-phosphate transport system substrate-binding protein